MIEARAPGTLFAGEPGPGKRVVWLVSRQHPGETMAEWFTEGFLERLTDPHDGPAIKTLKQAVFYVVSRSPTLNALPQPAAHVSRDLLSFIAIFGTSSIVDGIQP